MIIYLTQSLLISPGTILFYSTVLKDTHSEKVSSNKTPALTRSTNMDILVVGTSNQVFIEVLKLKQSFLKNKVVTGKTPFFVIRSFCSHHSTCLNIGV